MEATTEPPTYTLKARDLARHYAVSPGTVYNWVKLTNIPHRKIGGVIRFNLAEVDEWAAERPG